MRLRKFGHARRGQHRTVVFKVKGQVSGNDEQEQCVGTKGREASLAQHQERNDGDQGSSFKAHQQQEEGDERNPRILPLKIEGHQQHEQKKKERSLHADAVIKVSATGNEQSGPGGKPFGQGRGRCKEEDEEQAACKQRVAQG